MFPANARLLFLTALVGGTALFAARMPTVQAEAHAEARPPVLARHLGAWTGVDLPVSPEVRRALPGAAILSRRYESPMGEADVTIIAGADATVLHDPHDCLTGEGWEFIFDRPRRVDLGLPGDPINVREVVMNQGSTRARMWYWYAIGEETDSSTLAARFAVFRARLTEGRGRQAGFVRLIVGGETDSARTGLMLRDLAAQVVKRARLAAP